MQTTFTGMNRKTGKTFTFVVTFVVEGDGMDVTGVYLDGRRCIVDDALGLRAYAAAEKACRINGWL